MWTIWVARSAKKVKRCKGRILHCRLMKKFLKRKSIAVDMKPWTSSSMSEVAFQLRQFVAPTYPCVSVVRLTELLKVLVFCSVHVNEPCMQNDHTARRPILVHSWYYTSKPDKSKRPTVVRPSNVNKRKNYYWELSRIKRKVAIVDNIAKLFSFIVILKCIMTKKVNLRYLPSG